MSIAYIAGNPAFIPMDPYEMEQFLYALGHDGPGATYIIDDFNDFHGFPIDWGSDLRQMNRLAQRIADLGDSREALKAWCYAQEHCTAEDALRASYNMGSIMYMPGMDCDEELGEFALENDMLEEYNSLPDGIYEALDKTKAGAKMREMEGGVFVNGGYLLADEDFSGEPLPAEESLAYFQVRFSDAQHDSGWCDVPLSESDERLIGRVFGCNDFSGLPIENRSIIPYLNRMISSTDELPELNLLSEALNGKSGEEIMKYKALLEVVQPGTASTALRLADELTHYDAEPQFANPATYGRQYLDDRYNFNEHDSLLQFIDYAGFGAAMLNEDGYLSTRYGAVYMNVMAQKFLAGPNTVYGSDYYCGQTEGYPTCVCWDQDAQKVWLELNAGTADSIITDGEVAGFSYYQSICENWGIRHCASQEDYEQVLDELGVQSYNEFMAAAMEDQGMGGMGGMA